MESQPPSSNSFLDRPLSSLLPRFNIETLLIIIILVLAIISRFYNLDLRVMSHDEVNHVVPSFELFQGRGYRHDPVTHGPFQFHVIALSFFLLGDNDFSARVPAATLSVAAVAFVLLAFRRYLGKTGALIAGTLFLISPYMLFYGRYARDEGFTELFGVVMIYAVLRYLDKGDHLSLYLLTAATILHFTAEETAFIYTAQLLLFVGLLFLFQMARIQWPVEGQRKSFVFIMGIALFSFFMALGLAVWSAALKKSGNPDVVSPSPTATQIPTVSTLSPQFAGEIAALGLAILLAILGVILLVRSIGWQRIRAQRSFDILILVGTLVLPQLSAFPVRIVGWDPLDYQATGLMKTGIFVVLFFLISIGIGIWWNRKLWLINAALFYGVFTVFYTTFFTNGQGFFTGLVGSLGYWLSQQSVERGSQPWYFYAAIQIPIYEYLAALGTILALYFGIRHKLFSSTPGISPAVQPPDPMEEQAALSVVDDQMVEEVKPVRIPILALLLFWSLTSLVAFSLAGEKMPWLTVHIALAMLLSAGWGLGYLVDSTPWEKVNGKQGLIALLLIPVFLASLSAVMGALLGKQPPFMGNSLDQLNATNSFLLSVIVTAASIGGIVYLLKDWPVRQTLHLMAVVFFVILGILTARAAYMASFVNYDYATEFLVYAHAAPGPKQVLAQVEEISRRTTGGLDIQVAYDNDALYPYWWYLRNYPNHRWYTDKPTRDLTEVPLIIAGDSTSSKVTPILKDNYVSFDYIRLWWPMQDYYNLTWERIWSAIIDPNMRAALFDIWLNRDYRAYASITNNQNLKVEDWQPSARMKFFIRKDVISKIWNYGTSPVISAPQTPVDPYLSQTFPLQAELTVGGQGSEPGQFQSPRGVAAAPDGTIYVADSRNHRIQHLTADGKFIQAWGTFSEGGAPTNPGGSFNEPWGVAVGPDGSVYVADTWNYRIQKFTADGKFLKMWGYSGQGEKPEAFWGPRDVKVDGKGRVFVSDTGNKRIVVFSSEGEFITQFGTAGVEMGQLDEPVGIALGKEGQVYVVDTWNQRVQVFSPDPEGKMYFPIKTWNVSGWFGQSLDNKPYIALDSNGNIYITDPEGYRVLEFNPQGEFVKGWTDWASQNDITSLPVGISVDSQDRVWVTDAGNNSIYRFRVP